jgi:hypothetical protein
MIDVQWERAEGGERKAAVARDASLGGLFIETDKPLEEGALLSVEIADGGDKVVLEARVLTSQADGMAVRFIDLPEDVAGTLRRILARKLPRENTVMGIGMEPPTPPPSHGETIPGVTATNREATVPGIAPPPEMIKAALEEQAKKKEAEKTIVEQAVTLKKDVPEELEPPKEEPAPVSAKPVSPPPPPSSKKPEKPPPPKPKTPPLTESSGEIPAPPGTQSNAVRWFFVLLLAGGAVAAYVYREEIGKLVAEQAAPSATPVASTPPPPVSPPEAAAPEASTDDASALAMGLDAKDASADATVKDAGVDAASRDAGPRDAGPRDAGRKEAGAAGHDAGHGAGTGGGGGHGDGGHAH